LEGSNFLESDKSWIGTLGMLIGGWLFAAGILSVFVIVGIFPTPWTAYLPAVTAIAITGCLVESLPLHDIDNLTVTLTAVILGTLLF
jgi:dolichol kinase